MKEVAAGLILDKNGDILLARRAKTEPLANWYEFPGGKLEKSETPEMALVRELKEEIVKYLVFLSRLYINMIQEL